MCGSDVAFKKLFKVAGTQQIDRQWKGRLKSFVFSNLHRKVKTSQGSEVNTAVAKAGVSVRLASKLENQVAQGLLVWLGTSPARTTKEAVKNDRF